MAADSSPEHSAQAGETGVGVEDEEIQFLPTIDAQYKHHTFEELTNVANEMIRNGSIRARETHSCSDTVLGVQTIDPALDPADPHFNAYKWAKEVLHAAEQKNVQFRRTSFSFKDLDVSGFGSAASFQANVASVFMIPLRLGEYFTFGKRPEKKILHSFDGVVKSGEILLVLGRPGSGCSTFLKTMAGELHGLQMGNSSVLHYSGIAISRGEVGEYSLLT